MKIFRAVAKWLLVLCVPLFLLTASIGWAVNSLWFYEYGFRKYDISQTTGLSEVELRKAAVGLISYFNSGEEYINLTVLGDGKPFVLFNQREVVHLKDVKALIWLDYRVLVGTLIYVLAFAAASLFWWKERRQLAWGVAGGSILTLGLVLAVGLGALLDFDRFFIWFHLLSFANDFWQLDPARDYLIMLFPEGFWQDAALLCGGGATGLAIILGGVAGWYLRRTAKPRALDRLEVHCSRNER